MQVDKQHRNLIQIKEMGCELGGSSLTVLLARVGFEEGRGWGT
jgi:hypothetical protein